jgi:prophage regulatory protein
MKEQLLRLPAVLEATGLARSTLYRFVKNGAFPRPIKIGGSRAAVWLRSAVRAWIQERIQAGVAAIPAAQNRCANAGESIT